MSKDTISEGGPLMDPASSEFTAMLDNARTKAEAALAVKQDTTVPETKTDASKEPGSSPDGKENEENADDELSDDVEKLKNQVRGFKAELARVRSQKTSSSSEVAELRERLAKTEGRLEELKETKTETDSKSALKKLTDDKLFDMHTAYEDELADARATARQAERDSDRQAIAEANARIRDARTMLTALKKEQDTRVREHASRTHAAGDEQAKVSTELETLYQEVFQAVPDLADEKSAIWKAGQEEFNKLPTLMKKIGPMGQLIATAAAIAKHPELVGKKSTEKILDKIETVADKAFNRGGTAPKAGTKVENYVLNNTDDVTAFEEQVRRVKLG